MTVLSPPGYLQAGTYSALLDRIYLNTTPTVRDFSVAHRARGGFLPSRTPTYSSPAGLQIAVSACAGIIANTFATDAGEYRFANPSSTTVTLAASSPTQNRIDLVGFLVRDNFYDSSGFNDLSLAVVQGTNSAGVPSAPAVPAGFLPVVEVLINANALVPTSMTSRIVRTAPEGTPLLVANTTERNALGTPHAGQWVDRTDRSWPERYDGTAWRLLAPAIATSNADRDTAVTNPRAGDLALVTTTRTLWQHEGSAWIPYGQVAGRVMSGAGVQYTTAGTTELDMVKMRIENYRVKSGGWYIFWVKLSAQFGSGTDSFNIRVRKDTALSGTIVANFEWIGQVAGFTHTILSGIPWQASADDTDADFYVSVQRAAGANVLSVNGDERSSFWIDDRGGDSTIWSKVP